MILVFSDLHLGSKQSTFSIEKLNKLVALHCPTQIICIGDTTDLYISEKNRKFYSEFPMNTLFLQGNHDNIFSQQYYELVLNNKKIILFHGHQFAKNPFFEKYTVKINEFFLRALGINFQQIGRDLFAKQYPEGKFLSSLYAERTRLLAAYGEKSYDIVISGHTHYPEISDQGKFKYINVGYWDYCLLLNDDGSFKQEKLN